MGTWSGRSGSPPGVGDQLLGQEGRSRGTLCAPVGSHRGLQGPGGVTPEGSRLALAQAAPGAWALTHRTAAPQLQVRFFRRIQKPRFACETSQFQNSWFRTETKQTLWRPKDTLSRAGQAPRQGSGTRPEPAFTEGRSSKSPLWGRAQEP